METKSNSYFIDRIIKFLFVFYVFGVFVFSTNADTSVIPKIALILFCGGACLLFFNTYKIRLDAYFWYLFVFLAFTYLSSFWAIYPAEAKTKAFTLFQLLLMSVFSYSFFYAIDDYEFVIKSIFISSICMCIYMLYTYGISTYIDMLLNGVRVGSEITNVNSIGSYASIATLIGLYYAMFKNKKICYFIILLPLFIAFGTGSRKALLSVLIGGFFLFAFKFKSEFTAKNFFKTLVILIIVVMIFSFILQLEMFSTINERMDGFLNLFTGEGEVESSAFKRQMMIDGGLEQFKQTPLFGIGIGSSGHVTMKILGEDTYLHNNYVEILACGGIVGFICFYASFIYLLISLFKMVLKNNENAVLPFIILVIYTINQVAMVVYYSKSLYIYLVYCFLVVKKEKEKGMELNYE